ncbi:MAG: alpha-amylase [Chloroflexi bacterium]|nr:alpha-amylase [Chloroflexota bacterium]
MDFIFGTLATDNLKLTHHRAAKQGLQHHYAHIPLDPMPGEAVTIYVNIGVDQNLTHAACYYTTDGSIPTGSRGVASSGTAMALQPGETIWDTLAWGYGVRWSGTLPAQPKGTVVRYRISAWADGGDEIFADWPDVQDRAEKAAAAFFQGKEPPPISLDEDRRISTFTYHVDTLAAPAWAHKAVIYQIFVDRFYPGKGHDWTQTTDLNGFCGGTLWGVAEKIDYLAELGVNCLWLSPTFLSPVSHHGYDTTDYFRTEPRLGGDEALRAVMQAAHEKGMRVLLDLACNHLSDQHPYFKDALKNPQSPYRDWFYFDNSAVGYRAFFGVAGMPQINLTNPDTRAWMCEVGRYWIREFDADGYRLDYAHGPGPSFWVDFRAACRAEKGDCLCFGEIVDAPDALRTYIGRLDGCLDFHMEDALRKTYAWGTWTEDLLATFVQRHTAYFPRDFIMPTFLDNHDMDRFLFTVNGDKNALKRAAAAQMRLPNPPVIYYGTEVGVSQPKSTRSEGLHLSRAPMLWGRDQDTELLEYYKAVISSRQNTTL